MDYNDDILFLPLMSGSGSRDQRAIESIKLAQSIEDSQVKLECISMLYALLDKFGDKIVKKILKKLPSGYIEKINHISDETLDTIAADIFDISKAEELKKYF